MSSAPVVALLGPNGYLGSGLLPSFVNATQSGDFARLVIVTSKESDSTKKATADVPGKVDVFAVDYSKTALKSAFKGVDVIVNTLGGHGAQAPVEKILIEAAAEAGVKTYFNSEFGSDYDLETWGSSVFEYKKAHRAAAEKLGLKVVAIATGGFSESLRSPFFGLNGDDWEISGDGNYPFAITAKRDIGLYTIRAILLAHKYPTSVPSRLRIYSEIKKFNEYVDITEQVTGRKINRIYVPHSEILKKWEEIKAENPYYVLRVAADSAAQDFLGTSHIELLNPGHKYFTPESWEESVKATL